MLVGISLGKEKKGEKEKPEMSHLILTSDLFVCLGTLVGTPVSVNID